MRTWQLGLMGVICIMGLAPVRAFHGAEVDLTCHVCNASYYCTQGERFACPQYSLAQDSNANSIDDCVCLPGYLKVPGDTASSFACVEGSPPYYYQEGQQYTCAEHKETTIDKAGTIEACVCVPGYFGIAGDAPCTACAADTYNEDYDAQVCQNCPADSSHTSLGIAQSKSCLCDAGTTGADGGPCSPCAAGSFKSIAGNSSCQLCAENTFSLEKSEVCTACPSNSTSAAGTSSIDGCLCDPGYKHVQGGCEVCLPGRFKGESGNVVCTSCEAGYYTETYASIECKVCASNADSQTARDKCYCNAGYFQNSEDEVNPSCTACAADEYQNEIGQTVCKDCMAFAASAEASTTVMSCLCNAGYYELYDLANPTCEQCGAGTYKEAASDHDDDVLQCNACASNSNSLPGSGSADLCLCNAGYSGTLGNAVNTCEACAVGFYKAYNGTAECTACAQHYYSNSLASTVCESCVTFLNSDGAITEQIGTSTSDDCKCDSDSGYTELQLGGARTCSQCQAGTFATEGGCQNCTGGQFADVAGLTACKDCPANSSSYDYPHVACQCHVGYYCTSQYTGVAVPAVSMSLETEQCGFGECGSESRLKGLDLDSWQFIKGYVNQICTDISAIDSISPFNAPGNTYEDIADFFKAHPCAVANDENMYETYPSYNHKAIEGIWTTVTDMDGNDYIATLYLNQNNNVLIDFQAKGKSTLSSMNTKFQRHQVSNTGTSTIGSGGDNPSHDVTQFTFVIQQEQNTLQLVQPSNCHAGDCSACPVHTFKDYTGGAANCDACQANSVSNLASVSQDDCKCAVGYRQDGEDVCVACLHGQYADELDLLACKACPARYYTQTADFPWTDSGECNQCAICYNDEYDDANQGLGCGNGTATDCQACPEHKSLLDEFAIDNWKAGAQSCKCDAGYEPVDSNVPSTCQVCEHHYYKSSVGDVPCTQCPGIMRTESEGADSEDTCVCPGGYYFDETDGISCEICAAGTYKTGLSRQAVCDACKDHSTSEVGSDNQTDCLCLAGYGSVNGTCEICAAGHQKASIANEACTECAVDKFAFNLGTPTCEACIAGKSTGGLSAQAYCECEAGTERESANVLSACRVCGEGKFKPALSYENPNCTQCDLCEANSQVATECNATHDITCISCQANSWFPTERSKLGVCYCNAGYELIGSECAACPIGKARTTNMNNNIACETCQDGKFADTAAATECDFCTAHCNGTVDGLKRYVLEECDVTRDIVCTACTACPPGQYAMESCGISFNNDRNDTKCALCPAGSYCPGGVEGDGEDVLPIICPNNANSPAGSDEVADCLCNPGYYDPDGNGCQLCPFDFYCPGANVIEACPSPGRTFHMGSTVRLDCHCPRTYYRYPINDLTNFECALCTPNDYCFNNTLFNCTDPLMESDPGSGYFKNCTCIDRYYNDGEACTECNVNHFCVNGQEHACPEHEWTNSLPRQTECVCKQGYYREGGVCRMCPTDFYCSGTDDSRVACPEHSLAGNFTYDISSCECDRGYGAVYSSNVSEPHTCVRCDDDLDSEFNFYKDNIGNTACQPCLVCDPDENVYTNIVCNATGNAHCDTCSICHNRFAEVPMWKRIACNEYSDSVCENCTVCDHTTEWMAEACHELQDTECRPITFNRACNNGEYAGNHTGTKDSQCLACQYLDVEYQGARMHVAVSPGSYNDPYSCQIECLPFSRLRNVSSPVHGCETCETGNVLYKVFTQAVNSELCQFECLQGYVKVNTDGFNGGDCEIGALSADTHNYWNHMANVTFIERVESSSSTEDPSSGKAAFQFTVSHTTHGHYVIAVGNQTTTCTGRERIRDSINCCFRNLYRVSTKTQMGLAHDKNESCSAQPALISRQVSASQLTFEIPESRMHEIAECTQTADQTLDCVLYVNIVDMILFKSSVSVVHVTLQRGQLMTSVSSEHTYIPLSRIRVEPQFAYADNTHAVIAVVSDMQALDGVGNVEVSLRGTDLFTMPEMLNADCDRFFSEVAAVANGHSVWTIDSSFTSRHTSYMRSTQVLNQTAPLQVKLYYTLRLLDRENGDVHNQMHITVWRKIWMTHAVCQPTPNASTLELGDVLSCSGFGSEAVANLNNVRKPAHYVQGELGSLSSFVARASVPHIQHVTVHSMLLVNLLHAVQSSSFTPMTFMHNGVYEFNNTFKRNCLHSDDCVYHYAHYDPYGQHMFIMHDCSVATQALARKWLEINFGVVHDAGHVASLCNHAFQDAEKQARGFAFVIVLLNTKAYLKQEIWKQQQNHTAPQGTTYAFANFVFA